MLYTELNFARIWSSTNKSTPVFPPKSFSHRAFWQDLRDAWVQLFVSWN